MVPDPGRPEMVISKRERSREQGRAASRAPCAAGRPGRGTRRVSAMPISSIVRRAFTLPTPGSASITARTFILPMWSLSPASASSSDRVIDPIFSFSLISARARRASAALARACWRCSGVRAGGCGMRGNLVLAQATRAMASATAAAAAAGIVRVGDGASEDEHVGPGAHRLLGRGGAGLVVRRRARRPDARAPPR